MDVTPGLTTQAVAAFALTSLAVEITPGPNMTWLAVVAATEGRRVGFAAVAGVFLGLAVIGVAAALGLAALVAAEPALYQALRWGGVICLLWLAWDAWRDADTPPDRVWPGQKIAMYFGRGLVTNLLNPKAALFYLSVLPGFVSADAPAMPQTFILTIVYLAVATGIHAGIVMLAGAAQRLLEDAGRARAIRRFLALALGAVAVWFALNTA
jgi:threonine/homoserine/homoserine lactone efflux protein